jgi:hypothetical protein
VTGAAVLAIVGQLAGFVGFVAVILLAMGILRRV